MSFYNGKKIRNFEIIKLIGKGSYASVYKVKRCKDNNIYAMKVIDGNHLKKEDKIGLINEINILSKNNCPYLIKFYEVFIEKNFFYIVMEYAKRGDLKDYIQYRKSKNRFFSNETISKFFYQICKGVKYLHDHNVIHRDLKPANIFVDSNYNLKIGDFGISKIFTDQNKFSKTQIGSPIYMSPEAIGSNYYDTKTDIWALGCILYELETLNYAFNASSLPSLCRKIKSAKFNKNSIVNKHFLRIICLSLNTNQYQRPNIDSLIELIPVKPKSNQLNKTSNKLLPIVKIPYSLNQWDDILPKASYSPKISKNFSVPHLNNNEINDPFVMRSKSVLDNYSNHNNRYNHNKKYNNNIYNNHNNIYSNHNNIYNNKINNDYGFLKRKQNNPNKLKFNQYNNFLPEIKKKKNQHINNRRVNYNHKSNYGKNYVSPYNQYLLRNKSNANRFVSEYKDNYNNKIYFPKI